MTILLFLLVLFVLILVHELGHFAVAKWTGMRVDEFGIGFPPKLFGIRRGETEYSINALPIGGFVRIYGEDPRDSQSDITHRAFTHKSKWAQTAVLVAGVTMNILFAWLLYAAVLATGVPTIVDDVTAGNGATLTVAEVLPGSPAADAGVPLGADVVAIEAGGERLDSPTPDSFASFIDEHQTEEIAFTYHAGDTEETAMITPEAGVLEGSDQPAVGIALAFVDTVRYPVHVALVEAAKTTVRVLSAITVGIASLIADAVSFDADFSQVAGPVGIVGMVGDAADFGLASLLMFTALISLNLAVINLLPFPALDGGRLLFVAIEAVLRRPLDPVWTGRANFIGFTLLILLMLAVTYNDILRLV